MTDIERAMKAFREMSDSHQKEVLPVLLAVAIAYPRKPVLRLVVSNR